MSLESLAKLWFDAQTSTEWRTILYATNHHSSEQPMDCGMRVPALIIQEGSTSYELHNVYCIDGDSWYGNYQPSLRQDFKLIL